MDNYDDFILTDDMADNSSELADTPSENTEVTETTEVQGENEVTAETDTVAEPPKVVEQTETQRVAQRIKEEKQKARDSFVAEQYEGQLWNGKPITTEAELKVAVEESRLAEERQKLIDEGISELVADKMVKADRYINKAEQAEQAKLQEQQMAFQAEQAKKKDIETFITKFGEVDINKIDKSVWEEVKNGTSLVQAYTEFENKQLKEKVKTYEQNKQNKQKAPLSQGIATYGSGEAAGVDPFEIGFDSVK